MFVSMNYDQNAAAGFFRLLIFYSIERMPGYFLIFSCFKFIAILTTYKHTSEEALVAALQRKDRSALEYLYDHYSAALLGVVARIIKKEELAEEILQDVFLKIWDRIDSYDASKGKLFTWMLNIARNQAIDKTRSKEFSKSKKTDDIENLVGRVDRQDYTELRVEGIGLQEVLKQLPEEQRFVIDHHYLKGYTQAEMSEEFNLPLGTVKTRMRLAMKELRNLLKIK
jgi:RNA polymerase sigma factor (sigma-70 family)